jgi:hypothetical protein
VRKELFQSPIPLTADTIPGNTKAAKCYHALLSTAQKRLPGSFPKKNFRQGSRSAAVGQILQKEFLIGPHIFVVFQQND